jgi:hypothetical protein
VRSAVQCAAVLSSAVQCRQTISGPPPSFSRLHYHLLLLWPCHIILDMINNLRMRRGSPDCRSDPEHLPLDHVTPTGPSADVWGARVNDLPLASPFLFNAKIPISSGSEDVLAVIRTATCITLIHSLNKVISGTCVDPGNL